MGWWKIDDAERGQIDESHQTGNDLLNAVPGRDTAENYYNGDEPADAMGEAVDQALEVMGIAVPAPGSAGRVTGVTRQEVLDLFLARKVPARFAAHRAALLEAVSEAWEEIEALYEEEWERPAYPEERRGVCTFVLNPMFD